MAMNADRLVFFGELHLRTRIRKRRVALDAGQQNDKGTGVHNRNGVLLVAVEGRRLISISKTRDGPWRKPILFLLTTPK